MTERPDPGDHAVDDDLDVDRALAELGVTEDELDAALAELDAEEPPGLMVLWSPPAGLAARVERRARQRLHDREALAAFGDLFGLGWRTATVVLEEEEDDDDRRV